MKDKVILITGANRGIGKEVARQLAQEGITVLLGTRDFNKGEEAGKSIKGKVIACKLDVQNEENIISLAEYISKEFGRLDVLINNAGIGIGNKGSIDEDMKVVRDIMETNFFGAWRLSQVLYPLLRKSNSGRIVNVSSGMGALADLSGGYAGYRISKSALNALTILMANELENSNISVNAVCPGWVRTDMGGSSALRAVEKGAETIVWLATSEKTGTGKFWRDKQVIEW